MVLRTAVCSKLSPILIEGWQFGFPGYRDEERLAGRLAGQKYDLRRCKIRATTMPD
jgi:hypothetical protein